VGRGWTSLPHYRAEYVGKVATGEAQGLAAGDRGAGRGVTRGKRGVRAKWFSRPVSVWGTPGMGCVA